MNPQFHTLLFDTIVVNGVRMDPPAKIFIELMRKYSPYFLKERECRDLHGDLTFENILVKNGNLIYLDPNPNNIVSEWTLEGGKILQSLHSLYERLAIEGQFDQAHNHFRVEFPTSYRMHQIYDKWRTCSRLNFTGEEWLSFHLHEAIHFTRLLPYRLSQNQDRFPIYALRMRQLFADLPSRFSTWSENA